jgi:hypothetical protein
MNNNIISGPTGPSGVSGEPIRSMASGVAYFSPVSGGCTGIFFEEPLFPEKKVENDLAQLREEVAKLKTQIIDLGICPQCGKKHE